MHDIAQKKPRAETQHHPMSIEQTEAKAAQRQAESPSAETCRAEQRDHSTLDLRIMHSARVDAPRFAVIRQERGLGDERPGVIFTTTNNTRTLKSSPALCAMFYRSYGHTQSMSEE